MNNSFQVPPDRLTHVQELIFSPICVDIQLGQQEPFHLIRGLMPQKDWEDHMDSIRTAVAQCLMYKPTMKFKQAMSRFIADLVYVKMHECEVITGLSLTQEGKIPDEIYKQVFDQIKNEFLQNYPQFTGVTIR